MINANDELNIYKSGPTIALNKGGPVLNHNRNKLNDIFDNLPEDLKDAIASVDSAEVIFEISNKHRLHVDQTAILGQETGLVLLGVTDPTEFVGNLSVRLGVEKNTASQIVMEINEKIFAKVKESLRNLHSGGNISLEKSSITYAPNIMKNVETENLNVPKQTMDVLQGKVVREEVKDTSILGFNALETKMKEGGIGRKTEVEIEEKKPISGADPYRETM